MRLVTLFLLIQLGYTIAKAVETPRSCNDSLENEPRLKRSDEIDIDSEIIYKTREDPATTKKLSELNNENVDDLGKSDNGNEKTNEFASNPNTLPEKLPLVGNVTKLPVNIEKGGNITNTLPTRDAPLEETVYYKAIDPKYLFISRLSLPKANNSVTNISKTGGPVTLLEESKTALLNNVNTTKVMNVTNKGESNDNVGKGKVIAIDDRYTDVTNIRELRKHLLDHLLDYFINIIKEENFIRNNTRKDNNKNRMKVEEKLSNYYDPHHLDMLIADNDDDYDDSYLDHHGNDSEEDLQDNVEINRENVTNIHAFNTLADEIDKNAGEKHKSSEDLQNLPLNLEENLNSSTPDGESFNVNLPEPVTSEYIYFIEKENDLNITLSNTTEITEDAYNSTINVTTTEKSFSNEALNDETAEIDTDPLNYSEEVATDKIGYVYDNGALIIDDYTSYEDYFDSDEFQVTKDVTVLEKKINLFVDTKENGRRKNGFGKDISIKNGTLVKTKNETNNQNVTNNTASTTSKHYKDDNIKKLDILDHPNENIDDDAPFDEDNLSDNKVKNSSMKSKHDGNKGKLTRNKNCGGLVNKNNKSSKRHDCRKSIVLNLNINLI